MLDLWTLYYSEVIGNPITSDRHTEPYPLQLALKIIAELLPNSLTGSGPFGKYEKLQLILKRKKLFSSTHLNPLLS